jgi:hypothetical protein
MKRRLLLSSLLIALLAVVALGVPLAWAGSRLVRGEEHRRLDRLADAVGFVASGGSEGRQGPIAAATLTHVAQNERRVEVTDARGRRVAAGPRLAGPILQARITTARGMAVLVSEPAGPIDRQVHLLWLLVAGLALSRWPPPVSSPNPGPTADRSPGRPGRCVGPARRRGLLGPRPTLRAPRGGCGGRQPDRQWGQDRRAGSAGT